MSYKALAISIFTLSLTLCPLVVAAQQPSEIVIVKSLLRHQIKQWRATRRADLLSEPRSQFRLGVDAHEVIRQSSEPWRVPGIRLEYGFRVWDFLDAAMAVSYLGHTNKTLYTHNQIYANELNVGMKLNFTLRYSWFNRRWVSLYSSVGVRWEITYRQLDYSNKPHCTRLYSGHARPEIVPLGIRVGRRFFGYFEPLSITMIGFNSHVGLGFKF